MYAPHTPADRAQMLQAIGVRDVDELFAPIPPHLRCEAIRLAGSQSELELRATIQELAGAVRSDLVSFLGAGVYRHHVPAVVGEVIGRTEFSTAYTPYQPEVSQGTLQTIYEYQSLISSLLGLDVTSASHYDGATAAAEAALMACRATRRSRLLVSRGVHRHVRETLATYARGSGIRIDEIALLEDGPESGTTDLVDLDRRLAEDAEPVGGVLLAQPNFFGCLEPMAMAGDLAHRRGALFVAVVEPVSLAVLAPPGEYGADIAAAEGQPLGMAPSYGGPFLGILACQESLVRQLPGRLVGMTRDLDDRRAFVLTLQAREQHIRREKAASNICSNSALCALAASVYLASLGPGGLRDVALAGIERARHLEAALAAAGAHRLHRAPYLNEFAVQVPNARAVHARLLDDAILAGLVLADFEPADPALVEALLVCATELTTDGEINGFAQALSRVLDRSTSSTSRLLVGAGLPS